MDDAPVSSIVDRQHVLYLAQDRYILYSRLFLAILAQAILERRSSILFRGGFGGFAAKTTTKKELSRGPAAPKPPLRYYATGALARQNAGWSMRQPNIIAISIASEVPADERAALLLALRAHADLQEAQPKAIEWQTVLAVIKQAGELAGEANVRQAIGDVQQFRKEMDAALASYDAALTLFQAVGAKVGEANVLAAWSRLLLDSDAGQSQALLDQALDLRQTINDPYSMGADLGNYGIALLQRGRNGEAIDYFRRARELFASRDIKQYADYMDDLIAQAQGAPADPDMAAVLGQFEPLLQAIAAVARGDEADKAEIAALLPQLAQNGWQLGPAISAIWDGQRDPAALTADVDPHSAALIRRIMDILAQAPERSAG
jgi:tetratricopeptide (TPR) repeat protein